VPSIEIIALIYRSTLYLDFICKQLLSEFNKVPGFDIMLRVVANDPTASVQEALPSTAVPYSIYNDSKPNDYYLNRVYRCWNYAGTSSSADHICFVNSDMAFSPNWLTNLVKHHDGKNIVTSKLVESGRMPSSTHAHGKNFGMHPNEFRYAEWLSYASEISKPHTLPSGLFMPVLINKDTFVKSGGYPEGNIYTTGVGTHSTGRCVRSGDDFYFNVTLKQKYGMRHITAFDSVIYHFQSGEMLLPEEML